MLRSDRLRIPAIAIVLLMAAAARANAGGGTADLQLCKTDDLAVELCTGPGTAPGPDPVVAGNTLVYELEVVNNGPDSAEGVVLEDILPAEVDNIIFLEVPAGASCTAGTPGDPSDPLTCNLGNMTIDESIIVRFQVRVRPDAVTDPVSDQFIMHNDARVYSTITFDPDNSNDLAGVDTTVQAEADLGLLKFAIGAPRAGGILHYELAISNAGPSVARDVTLRDFLPDEVEFLDALVDVEGGTGGVPLPCSVTQGSNALFCPLGDIPPTDGTPILVIANVRIRSDVADMTVVTNNADVFLSDTPEPNFGNNIDSTSVNVLTTADLSIAKSSDVQIAQPGELVTYTISVTNHGPSDAQNVMVTDNLPAEVTYQIDTDSCVEAPAGTLTCSLGTLPAGESAQFDVVVQVNGDAMPDTTITNMATVSGETGLGDDNPDNDAATANTLIASNVSDLCVTKTAVGEAQVPGQPGLIFDIANPPAFPEAPNFETSYAVATAGRRIAYEINVENKGPSPATNVVVNDRLPAGVTIVPGTLTAEIFDEYAAMIGTGNCSTGTPGDPLDQMDCGLGTLGVGETAVIAFHVYVDTDLAAGTVLENDVSVSSDNPDGDNSSNQAFTQTIVNTWADMEITKISVGENVTGYDGDLRRHIFEDLPGEVTAGLELRYEITVQNNGASDAQNVQILDLLPGQSSTGLDHDPVIFLGADGVDCQPMNELQELEVFGPGGDQYGQGIWCNLGTVPAGARRTINIYVSVDPSVPDGTTLSNGAFVSWGPASPPAQPEAFLPFPYPQIPPELPTTDDPFLYDNFASTDTVVGAVSDVYIQKIDVPAQPALDQPFEPDLAVEGAEHRYLLTFGNEGPSVARYVEVLDSLDIKFIDGILGEVLGETFVRCEPVDPDDLASCSEADGVVSVDSLFSGNEQIVPGKLNPGDAFSLWLIVEVCPDYLDVADDEIATNIGLITTSTTDFHTANNTDTESTRVIDPSEIAVADLRIVKFGKPDGDVQAGEELTYTVIVDNLGPDPATGVAIVDLMQSDGDFDVLSVESNRPMICRSDPAADGGSPFTVPPDSGAATGVSQRYQLDGALDDALEPLQTGGPPNTGRWLLTVRVRANERQDINNVADVLSAVIDPNPGNNHAEVEHAFNDHADLQLVKVAEPDTVFPSSFLNYVLTATNNGPSAADNVVISDVVPAAFQIAAVSSTQGVCVIGTPGDPANPTTCLIGSLAAGDSATMTINVLVPSNEVEATFLNRATVGGEQFDPNNANNLSIATVSVVLPPPPPPQPMPDVCGCGGASAVPVFATIFGMVTLRRRTRRRTR
jgi:uncharacterized repeat protein (TIGR01451 family)